MLFLIVNRLKNKGQKCNWCRCIRLFKNVFLKHIGDSHAKQTRSICYLELVSREFCLQIKKLNDDDNKCTYPLTLFIGRFFYISKLFFFKIIIWLRSIIFPFNYYFFLNLQSIHYQLIISQKLYLSGVFI